MTFISCGTRLHTNRHALYAWAPPSPRVRCRQACFILTYYLQRLGEYHLSLCIASLLLHMPHREPSARSQKYLPLIMSALMLLRPASRLTKRGTASAFAAPQQDRRCEPTLDRVETMSMRARAKACLSASSGATHVASHTSAASIDVLCLSKR